MGNTIEPGGSPTGLNPRCDPVGKGDSERCIEIPWALSKYSGEQTVLDIGYANAEERYITALRSIKIPELHGIDISERKIDGIISHAGDIRNTGFEDNFFDLVFCISTIEHIGRDNSFYKKGFSEDIDNGDFEALKEIYRITKNNGKVLLTVPFGKFFNYGWFIHYDENRLNKLLHSSPFEIVEMDFFRYADGWHTCDKSELTNTLYKDNNAPAAAGLVCVLLKKKGEKLESIQKETTNELGRMMNDNTPEIRGDEINVEEIMKRIREKIRRRKSDGEFPPGSDTVPLPASMRGSDTNLDAVLQRDLSDLQSSADIYNNSYFISSHHPYLGKYLVKGRQLVHGEVRRYVDPMISRQVKFNANTVQVLNLTFQKYVELEQQASYKYAELEQQASHKYAELEQQASHKYAELEQQISIQEEKVKLTIKKYVDSQISDIFSSVDTELRQRLGLIHTFDNRISERLSERRNSFTSIPQIDTNYFLFEEKFRGSGEDIKQRQSVFFPYFKECSRVLDIGCGRGEFLETLRENNISGTGIDLDKDMVAYCQSRHLNVEQSDAIIYLEKLEDNSLDGIFIDQVVEHLEPGYLVRLLALCHQKLKYGSSIVIETVNPLSFSSFVNFYIDMTHKKPIHPDTLQFLLNAAGFRESEKKFLSPVADIYKLKKITEPSNMDEYTKKSADVYNHNVEILNNLLFGAQDYAVIGKKG